MTAVQEALRWLFWGLLYLATVLTALVLFFAVPGLPSWLRWGMVAVVLWGLALDVDQKLRDRRNQPGPGPPSGGEPVQGGA